MGILRQFLLVCAVWYFLDQVYSAPHRIKSGFKSCQSTETCVSYRQCPSFLNLLEEQGRNPLAVPTTTLVEKVCGMKNGRPKVCCPSVFALVATHSLEEDFSKCGKSKKAAEMSQKIIGGNNAKLGNWPWMVALFYGSSNQPKTRFGCGASLISKQWVITAAHCVADLETNKPYNTSTVIARLGELNLNDGVQDGASPIDASVDQIVVHPNYTMYPSNPTITNDMALVRLRDPVQFTENIHPICLLSGQEYRDGKYYEGKEAFIVGWGKTKYENINASDALLEASVPVVSQMECAKRYLELKYILVDDDIICAVKNGTSTCAGDSGGPLIFFNSTETSFYLGGITSGGYKCDNEAYPTRFTKVASYISWINEVTGEKY